MSYKSASLLSLLQVYSSVISWLPGKSKYAILERYFACEARGVFQGLTSEICVFIFPSLFDLFEATASAFMAALVSGFATVDEKS